MALAGQGRLNEAAAGQGQFEALRTAMPAELLYLLNNKASDMLALASATLDAQLAWARGEQGKSIQEWRRAVELESTLQYDEPPPWFYPVGQVAGCCAAAQRAGEGGGSSFRAAIDKHPRDGRLLFGLRQSLTAQQRENEAALVEQQFNAAWTNATVNLRMEDL